MMNTVKYCNVLQFDIFQLLGTSDETDKNFSIICIYPAVPVHKKRYFGIMMSLLVRGEHRKNLLSSWKTF